MMVVVVDIMGIELDLDEPRRHETSDIGHANHGLAPCTSAISRN